MVNRSLSTNLTTPMSVSTIIFIFFAFVSSNLCNIADADDIIFSSHYTSIKDVDCFETSKSMTAHYDRRQLDADECPAPKGWRLFRVFSLDSFWIDIAHGDSHWSTEKVVMKGLDYANPSLRPDILEWRMTKSGSPNAMIVRITTRDPETLKILSPIYVFNLADNTPRFCGIAKSNQEARNIADAAKDCRTRLPEIPLPK